jgi:iron complex outermembrane receptor protein
MRLTNKRKTQCIIILVGLIQWTVCAQTQMKVLDKETQQPLPYANVYFPDLKTGTLTDTNGIFSINATHSALLMQISCVGYKTFLKTINVESYKGAPQTIYLEVSLHDLQEVVISDNSTRLQGENVTNVEKINLINNNEIHGISLAQKLSGLAGISNISSGAGIGKPVIRGLSGNRIAVFSQGIRIENQQWGDEHGLGLDENGYEQVEIIKGAASLLYGSDALGGVLYFSDERYAKENSVEAVIGSEYHSNTNGWRTTGNLKLSKNRWHWNLFGGYTTHQDYKDGNQEGVNNSRFRSGDFKTGLGYTGTKFVTSLKYSFLHEQYGLSESNEDSINSYFKTRKPDFPYQDLTTHCISSENTFFLRNSSKLKMEIGYVFNNRKEFEDAAEGDAALNMNLGTLSYNVRWYSHQLKEHWTVIAGSQGMYQTNVNKGEELLIPDAITADAGLFAMSDYYYSKKSYWQVGVRMDGRHIRGKQHGIEGDDDYFANFSKSYAAFNFATGIYQQLVEGLSLRTNLSSGYRSPNMFELLSDGVHEGTNRYEIGSPNLKTENSYQADISLDYKSEHIELYLNPYFNYIRHYIYLEPTGETKEHLPVYHYRQADVFLYGGETGFHVHPHPLDWLHIEASYSNTFGQDLHYHNLPLMPSQKVNASLRTSLAWKKAIRNFSIYLQYQYSFAQHAIAAYETATADYNLINAGIAFDFQFGKQKILFNAAVNNVFNAAYYDHLSRYKQYQIYTMGRNISLRLSFPFRVSI